MRQLRFLILIVLAVMLLSGCGGGGGTPMRTVTIQVRWPAASASKSTRADVTAANTFTVEAYDGTVRVGNKTASKGSSLATTTLTMTLPAKDLTFYANSYAGTDPGYVTNPATGQPAHSNQGKYTLLSVGDVHPLSQAIMTVNVPSTPNLIFTMQNTITAISPATSNTIIAGSPVNQFSLDVGSVPLIPTIQATSADGASSNLLPGATITALMVDPAAYTWALDPTDNLATSRATVHNIGDPMSGGGVYSQAMMDLKATGTVRVIVTNTQTSPLPNITATITYTITPSATQQTFTLLTANTATQTSNLLATCPRYAKSLTLTLTQDPNTGTNTTVLDNPPPPVNSGPFPIAPVFNAANTAITGVTIASSSAPAAISFTPTGRTVKLLVQVWSQANGNGVLLAEATLDPLSPITATLNPSLTFHVTGFVLTPANPTSSPPWYLVLTNTPATNSGFPNIYLNNMTMQVAAILDSTDANSRLPIDPRALGPTGFTTDQTTTTYLTVTTPAAPVDANGNPYIQITGSSALGSLGSFTQPVVLTATDPVTTKSGQATITVEQGTLNYGFNP